MQRGFLDRPDCRLYYEVEGKGPMLVFAHGLGGNHMSWWQQVPHFRDRYTCVTFAHRGFLPSSMPPGGPDPKDYPGDLAALIDHLGAADVRLVAQSMGGWSALEYAFAQPARVKALVMASTGGTLAWATTPLGDNGKLAAWMREAGATSEAMFKSGVHPAGGARLAREQPAAQFLYQQIDGINAALDKMALRQKLAAALTRPLDTLRALTVPTLWLTGAEDVVYPAFVSDLLAPMMPNARVTCVPDAGHSVYFERPETFNRLVHTFLAANS